jgi:hypothetical protein
VKLDGHAQPRGEFAREIRRDATRLRVIQSARNGEQFIAKIDADAELPGRREFGYCGRGNHGFPSPVDGDVGIRDQPGAARRFARDETRERVRGAGGRLNTAAGILPRRAGAAGTDESKIGVSRSCDVSCNIVLPAAYPPSTTQRKRLIPFSNMPTTHTADCNAGEKIQDKITMAKPRDTILVSGACNENVAILSETVRITLDGVKGARKFDGGCIDRLT